ncbi:MAG: periplasmic heavy metal sensor [Amphiplicatus sp.]
MNRGLTILLALSVAANVFLGGFVAGRLLGGPPHDKLIHTGDGGRAFSFKIAAELDDLSPDAREAFRKVFGESRERLIRNHREAKRLRKALSDALAADPWNRTQAEAALAELRAAESAQQAALATLLIDAFEGLSAEDRKALTSAMDNRERRKKHMRLPDKRIGDRDGPPPLPPGEGDGFPPPPPQPDE